jgi:hypothetical protein
MDTKDKEINNLLQQGYSYREIATKLGISTRRIAEVKKACSHQETASDKGFRAPENTLINTLETKSNQISSNNNQLNLKNTSMENNENNFRKQENGNYGYPEVEIKKLELNHDLEIRKLALKEREIKMQEENQRIEKDKLAHELKKNGEEERSLKFRLDKLVERCVDGTWEHDDAIEYFNEMEKLKEDVEKFETIHRETVNSFMDYDLLQLIFNTFDEFTEDWDEDEEEKELEFNQDLKDALESSE